MMLGNDIEVARSRIEGRGVFALRDFEPGETVIEWDLSHELSDEQYAALTDDQRRYVDRYEGKWIFMQPPASYVNHSCEANTRPGGGADIAVRHIGAGEEITSDYRSVMKAGERMECRCRAESCLGYIEGTAV